MDHLGSEQIHFVAVIVLFLNIVTMEADSSTGLILSYAQKRIRALIVEAISAPAPRRLLIFLSGISPPWIERGSGVTTAFIAAAADAPSAHTIIVSHDGRHCVTRCKTMYETFIRGRHAIDRVNYGIAAELNRIRWYSNNTTPLTVKETTFVHVFSMMYLVGAMVLADLPFKLRPDLMTCNLRGMNMPDTHTPYLWPNTTHLDLVALGTRLLDPATPLSHHTHVTSVVSHQAPSEEQIRQWEAVGWTVVDANERVNVEPNHEQ